MAKSSTGRAKRATGKHKRSTGRMKSASGRRSAVKQAPKLSGHAVVEMVCAECLHECVFDTGNKADELICPCGDRTVPRPDDVVLGRLSSARSGEKRNFVINFIIFLVAFGCLMTWMLLMQDSAHEAEKGLSYGLLGGSGVGFLILMVMTFKYESDRWEAYF